MESTYTTQPRSRLDGFIKENKRLSIHIILFLLTLFTTTLMGMAWQGVSDLLFIERGLSYSLSLLFILSCHEFGHYFAARFHKVKTTLPYYIPMPPISMPNFGTLGAVIRMKEPIPTRKALFDIGIAGPIAGFIASLFVLVWGFTHLPGTEFILQMHPDFNFDIMSTPNATPGTALSIGSTILYDFMSKTFSPAEAFVPPMTEMYHYPFLLTGWFGLFITALNLLPVGQLDGGHIAYAMFGSAHRIIARIFFFLIATFGILSLFPYAIDLLNSQEAAINFLQRFPFWDKIFWSGWVFWSVMILFIIRLDHPPIEDPTPLSSGRMMLGWFAWVMFIVSFSPVPFTVF